jgi:CRP-like cAMP-binding protein
MRAKGETVSGILGFLAGIPLFSKLSESCSFLLSRESRFKYVEKGDILFFQSDPSESAYIVRTGTISIILNSPDGREMVINEMHCGDLFGEVAAVTGMQRTANVITEEDCKFLIIPAKVMKRLARNYSGLNVMLHTTIGERLSLTELPLGTSLDQGLLRELRTSQVKAEMETEPTEACGYSMIGRCRS